MKRQNFKRAQSASAMAEARKPWNQGRLSEAELTKKIVLLFAVLALTACNGAQKDSPSNANKQTPSQQQLDLVPFSRGPVSPPNVKGP